MPKVPGPLPRYCTFCKHNYKGNFSVHWKRCFPDRRNDPNRWRYWANREMDGEHHADRNDRKFFKYNKFRNWKGCVTGFAPQIKNVRGKSQWFKLKRGRTEQLRMSTISQRAGVIFGVAQLFAQGSMNLKVIQRDFDSLFLCLKGMKKHIETKTYEHDVKQNKKREDKRTQFPFEKVFEALMKSKNVFTADLVAYFRKEEQHIKDQQAELELKAHLSAKEKMEAKEDGNYHQEEEE